MAPSIRYETPEHILCQALDLLQTIVGNGTRANYHARMNPRGTSAKYTYVKDYSDPNIPKGTHLPITDEEIEAHLTGAAT